MTCQVALLEATDTQRPERQKAVDRSHAEWIVAAARAATGSCAEAVATWARSLPEHAEAREGNAEGAGAAAEADACSPAKRFRPSARAECFLGSLAPGEDGRRHMVPSLDLTESQRRGIQTLPADLAPTVHDAHQDPRVAWTDGSRVWAETPRRLHWILTDEQRTHITRQREAALRRRTAPPMHPRRDAQVVAGTAAAEAERPLEPEPRHMHGVNHARQTQAETFAAEERADRAAVGDGPRTEWHVQWDDDEIEEAERDATHAAYHEEDPMAEAWEATLTAERAALTSEFDELECIADAFHDAGRMRATGDPERDARRHSPPLDPQQQIRMAEQRVFACERRHRCEEARSRADVDALTAASELTTRTWEARCEEARAAREAAEDAAKRWEWGQGPIIAIFHDANARNQARQEAARRMHVAQEAVSAANAASLRRAQTTERLIRHARADLARVKRANGAAATDITSEEQSALDAEDEEEATRREDGRRLEAERTAAAETADRDRTRAAAAEAALKVARRPLGTPCGPWTDPPRGANNARNAGRPNARRKRRGTLKLTTGTLCPRSDASPSSPAQPSASAPDTAIWSNRRPNAPRTAALTSAWKPGAPQHRCGRNKAGHGHRPRHRAKIRDPIRIRSGW